MSNHFSTDHRGPRIQLLVSAALLAGLTLAGCSREPDTTVRRETEQLESMPVELVTIPDQYEAVGTIRSTTRSRVASKVMGTVVAVSVAEGDFVRSGQLILQIDPRESDARIRKAEGGIAEVDQGIGGAEAALRAAEANLDLARATYRRYEVLREKRSVSPQEFDEVEARFRAAEAEYSRVERQLGALRSRREQALADLYTARTHGTWARVTSPIDGVITARYVDAGDVASPGMPLVVVDDPSSYRLDVQVDESRLSLIRPGDPVSVRVESLDTTLRGVVEAIAPAVDPATRSALVKIDLPETPGLQSGRFARVWFRAGERSAIVVPTSLIVERGQLEGVWVPGASGEPRFRLIRTGATIGNETEVLSGLSEGDRIISEIDRNSESLDAADRAGEM